ncbi:hypothetical protein CIK05_07485 [Bdellovibrio sp. qaytius]|nr:hypothetical protein CIK05_07485 [Bdellovibrio sp. qaytius]
MKKQILITVSLLLLATQSFADKYSDLQIGASTRQTCSPDGEAQQFSDEMVAAWDKTGNEEYNKVSQMVNKEQANQWMDLLMKKTERNEKDLKDLEEMAKSAACITTLLIKGNKVSIPERLELVRSRIRNLIEANKAEFESTDTKNLKPEEIDKLKNGNDVNNYILDNIGAIAILLDGYFIRK